MSIGGLLMINNENALLNADANSKAVFPKVKNLQKIRQNFLKNMIVDSSFHREVHQNLFFF